MEFSFTPPTPLEFFATLVHSDADFPLLEAAVSLAQDEYPELDVQMVLEEVDLLLARLQRRVAADAGPLQKLRLLNQFFFRESAFFIDTFFPVPAETVWLPNRSHTPQGRRRFQSRGGKEQQS